MAYFVSLDLNRKNIPRRKIYTFVVSEFVKTSDEFVKGLESRRACALAFSNVLQMVKEGKISCEQDEYFGPIMVRKI